MKTPPTPHVGPIVTQSGPSSPLDPKQRNIGTLTWKQFWILVVALAVAYYVVVVAVALVVGAGKLIGLAAFLLLKAVFVFLFGGFFQ